MKLYRFSPIKSQQELLRAIEHIHFACYQLCKQSFERYLPNAGNIGVFCHYDDEYEFLTKLRQEMAEASANLNQKYFKLHEPITIPAKDGVPETTYTYLYIRQPDPYRSQVGDVDFYLPQVEYDALKQSLAEGKKIKGARIFPRQDLDLIELYDPDVDCCGYVSTKTMTQKVHVKQA
ncbi:MAG TPA: hypothetical protein VFB59_03040 [Candidatus Saccharimonadales bacterium]|nr:hypothetical protein [Candidatus Saccharimonadales bacterium]